MTEPAVPAPGGGGLVRVRIDLGYDGTQFSGWARQPRRRTVQQVLEEALGTVLRTDPPRTICAGRTDAGVHARGQVVHIDLAPSVLDAVGDVLVRRLAGVLPADVGLRGVRRAPPGFDARFSALWRRYTYRVCDAELGFDPLHRLSVLDHGRPLDVGLMTLASEAVTGEHDFAAFCRRREGATTVRTLLDLSWARGPDGIVEAQVVADAFCHSMVRSLVGALLAVGDGRRAPGWVGEVLSGRSRPADLQVAPAHGLTLEEVRYPADNEVAERAAATRRRRGGRTR